MTESAMTVGVQVPTSMVDLAVRNLLDLSEQADKAGSVIDAADSGNVEAMVKGKRSEHSRFAEYENLLAQAEAVASEIDKETAANLTLPTDVEVATAKQVIDVLRGQAQSLLGLVKQWGGEDAMPEVSKFLVVKRGRPPGSVNKATGEQGNVPSVKKPRLTMARVNLGETVLWQGTTDDPHPNNRPTFTNIARVVTDDSKAVVGTEFVKREAFKAAGIDPLTGDLSDHNGELPYTLQVNKATYNVTVTPKQ